MGGESQEPPAAPTLTESHLRECAGISPEVVPMLTSMRKGLAALTGALVAAVAVFVLIGMIDGAVPNFSKGRSSTQSVVAQEVVGAFALVALGGALVGCINVARGKHVGRLLIPLLVALVLVVAWQFAYLVERAS